MAAIPSGLSAVPRPHVLPGDATFGWGIVGADDLRRDRGESEEGGDGMVKEFWPLPKK